MVKAIEDAAPNDLIANELIIVNEVLGGAIAIFTEELDRIGNTSNVNENVGIYFMFCTIVSHIWNLFYIACYHMILVISD